MQEKERGRDFTGKPVVEGGWGLFAIHQTDRVCVCARACVLMTVMNDFDFLDTFPRS